ncbi:MAG: Fic family protein, partial [Bacteroidia bacterium]|nr:Fic family protein [Bacteroidia bacterium]
MFEKDLKEIDNLKNQWADLLSVEDVYSEKWNLYYDVQFVYDSNRIEGSTLSLIDTALLIEKGLSAKGKPFVHHLDAINHKNALDFIKTKALSNTALDEAVLLKIHETVLEHNKGNAGVYRRANVRITNTTFLPPNYVKVPHLMEM